MPSEDKVKPKEHSSPEGRQIRGGMMREEE